MQADDAAGLLQTYYEILDRERHNLSQVYRNQSAVIYNGQPFNAEAFARFYNTMPQTQHTMMSYDCHPLADGMVVTTSGSLKLGNARELHGFSQSFLIRRDTAVGSVYIESDSFRLVT